MKNQREGKAKTEKGENRKSASEPAPSVTPDAPVSSERSSLPLSLRWFISKTVREATAMRKHVNRLLCAQKDILSTPAVAALTEAIREMRTALTAGLGKAELRKQMEQLEEAANKWLKPYPSPNWRENIEVLLVALAVAMGIRTFFVQPFKIPTGSMQPTLFGVTSQPDFTNVRTEADYKEQLAVRDGLAPLTGWNKVRDWFAGGSLLVYHAEESGPFQGISRPLRFLIFNFKQTLWIGGRPHTMWFPPDSGGGPTYNWGNLFGLARALFSNLPPDDSMPTDLERRLHLRRGQPIAKGEPVIKIKVHSGDHLFVDRLSYNFRKPKRGEIIVFQTAGINPALMPQDQFYIKRLVALGGEKVQIGDDRHLIINETNRLDASTPHFENVYTFNADQPPTESQYSGHVNEVIGAQVGRATIAPLFPNENASYTLPPDTYMVMGDNTVNSKDSREWGEFPAGNVIGKSFFVYWPITDRFGWGHR